MNDEEKKNMVTEALVEVDGKKKLPCAKAFIINKEHGIPLKEIGNICNDNGIKISSCQLGCFK